jgi:glycosyltransferase involved in cell wall biosynthesis
MSNPDAANQLPFTLLYFGCDGPWIKVRPRAARRRNTAILQALGNNESVARVLVINYELRAKLPRELVAGPKKDGKILDVFITNVFPERWGPFWQKCNRWLISVMIHLQAGPVPKDHLVVWSYWPNGFELAKRVGLGGTLVFDADHDLLHDPNQTAGRPEHLEPVLRECAKKADLIVAASRSMLEWFRQNGASQTARLRNGVDPARFPSRRKTQNSGRPRIGCVGWLSNWFDFGLLGDLVTARPDWSFIVAGPTHRTSLPQELTTCKNIDFAGAISPADLPNLLASFDVALALYRSDLHLDMDSMKLFEYLAAGVPVVSSPFHDYLAQDFEGLLKLATDAQSFEQKIQEILEWDEATRIVWQERCARFVLHNTWSDRADEVIRLLRTIVSNTATQVQASSHTCKADLPYLHNVE